MNKVIFCLSLFVAAMLTFMTACEDNRDNYTVASRVGFVNPGYSEFDVIRGMGVEPSLMYVVKSGKGQQSAKVTLSVKDVVLDKYNQENGTAFQLVPSNCYTFVQQELNFGGSDYRKAFEVDWNEEQLWGLTPGSYAFPLEMSTDNPALLATERSIVLIAIHVKDAYLEAETPRLYDVPLKPFIGDLEDKEIMLNVQTTYINKSGLTYKTEVDPQLLTDYNAVHGTNYQLLPTSAYTLQTEWLVPAGQNKAPFKLIYHGTGLNPTSSAPLYGEYVVPIRITPISSDDVEVKSSPDAGYILFPVIFRLFDLNRETAEWSMIAHNNSYFDEAAGGWYELRGPQLMIDSDPATFWMSTWTLQNTLPFYITFDMKGERTVHRIEVVVPSGNEWRAYQKTGHIEVSLDNEHWETLLNWSAVEGNNFSTNAPTPLKGRYIRLWITESYTNPPRAAIGEFKAWGQ